MKKQGGEFGRWVELSKTDEGVPVDVLRVMSNQREWGLILKNTYYSQ